LKWYGKSNKQYGIIRSRKKNTRIIAVAMWRIFLPKSAGELEALGDQKPVALPAPT
jgi:hypothetical protein